MASTLTITPPRTTSKQLPSRLRNSSPFIIAEGSLLCLEELTTGPYPEINETCTHPQLKSYMQ
jgi:hypothetical protein